MAAVSRRAPALLLSLVLLTAFCAAFHTIIEEDLWWHLRAGADIVAGRGIPRVDTYSYPSAGRPYIDLHWLFQVLVHLVYAAAGLHGVVVAKCLVVVATFWIVYRLARRTAPAPIAATLTGVGVILASERFLARPEVLTFLFLALTLWLLERHQEGAGWAWRLLPLVTLVWVNTEGLFILGLGVVAAHLLGRSRDRRLWLALGLSTAASLANPYLLTGALHPLVLFTRISGSMAIYSRTIGEFLSPFAPGIPHPSVAVFPFFLGLIAVALLLHGRRPAARDAIVMAAFLYLACRARRNLAPLAIAAVPIIARWMGRGHGAAWLRARWDRASSPRRTTAVAALAGAICAAFLGYDLCLVNGMIYEAIGTNRSFGAGLAEASVPVGAASFLREHGVSGPLFNNLSSGGYLAYAYPQGKVFIDGRLEVHPTEHYAEYVATLAGGDAWKRAEERYRFQSLVLSYAEAPQVTYERLQDPTWAPVFLDGTAVVLVKQQPENRDLIDRFLLTRQLLQDRFPGATDRDVATIPTLRGGFPWDRLFRFEPIPWREIYLGQFFALVQMPELAVGQYLRAVQRAPHALTPRLLLASALSQTGRVDGALRILNNAESLCWSGARRREIAALRAKIRSAPAGDPSGAEQPGGR